MPLHALAIASPSLPQVIIASSAADYDVVAENPWIPTASPVVFGMVIESGVVLSSSDATIPALSFAGLHADSVVTIIKVGAEIRGAGGAGARGGSFEVTPSTAHLYGGGGGGAGTIVGPGGLTYITPPFGTETVGVDGLAATGGAGGINWSGVIGSIGNNEFVGQQGGTAIFTPCLLQIDNTGGFIYGGGGGGAPGYGTAPLVVGTAGGAIGAAGVTSAAPGAPAPGAAGYAVNHTGPVPTWIGGGSSPDVEGTIG